MRTPPNETAEVESVDQPPRSSRAKRGDDGQSKHVPERTCILTRRQAPRTALIRLAIGPDGQVAPDIRARAPGRGAWIGVDHAALAEALAKGKLRGALQRAFKTQALQVPDDLPERVEAALRQAVLDRLGLEAKAGYLVSGAEKIDVAARRGQVALLIHADDAGGDGRAKLDQALRVGGSDEARGLVFPGGRAILSLALGRQNVVHAAVLDRAAAARVRDLLDRWRAFIGRDAALEAASAAAGAPVIEAAVGGDKD